jgi:hypothetical protein
MFGEDAAEDFGRILHLVERVNIWLALDGLGLQINFN